MTPAWNTSSGTPAGHCRDPSSVRTSASCSRSDQRTPLGSPRARKRALDRLEIRGGDSVCHIGACVDYYSAIIAELAGPDGKVVAAEIDPELAGRARANLAARPNVEVIAADGSVTDPGMVDVIVPPSYTVKNSGTTARQ